MKTPTTLAAIAAFGILAAGCAATPDEDGALVADDEGIICRSESEMGSNMRKRVCTTRAEREEIARRTKEEITNRQRSDSVIGENTLPSAGN